jgi:hypothetical protein
MSERDYQFVVLSESSSLSFAAAVVNLYLTCVDEHIEKSTKASGESGQFRRTNG